MYSYNEDHHGTDEIETTTGELEGAEITVYQMGDSVLANLEAELEAKTIRKTAKKCAILEMVQQEIQKAIFQGDVAQHFGNILDAVKERERQLHTTISNMKADHTKLINAQKHLIHINDQVQTALAHQETLMLKLKTENEKLTFEYNRLKYQRQADVRTMIQHEEEELKRGIDRTSTSILAENERAFQQLRNARIQSHTADLERICVRSLLGCGCVLLVGYLDSATIAQIEVKGLCLCEASWHCQDFITSVVNNNDIVPRLSLLNHLFSID